MSTSSIDVIESATKARGRFADYVAIARLDHSTKHVFIVPGIILAYLLRGIRSEHVAVSVILGLLTAVCIASANYVINEWLDREFDKHHPRKSARSAVQKELSGRFVLVEWIILVAVGLTSAASAGKTMLVIAAVFALQGIVYNVSPIRTKDKPYLDVISESVNNPLRLMIGWAMIDPTTLPPSSIILTYWLGGAFLMGSKRLSEYREITATHGKDLLVRYRASFSGYTEATLTASCFFYALSSTFFLAVFLLKYRVEYILLVPIVTTMFSYYLMLSMAPGSSAQRPERLFRETGLILLVLALAIAFVVLSFVTIPALAELTAQQYISIR